MISAGDIHLSMRPGAFCVGLTATFLLLAWMLLFGEHSGKTRDTFDILLHRVNALRRRGFLETQHGKRAAIKVRAKLLAEALDRITPEKEFFRQRS